MNRYRLPGLRHPLLITSLLVCAAGATASDDLAVTDATASGLAGALQATLRNHPAVVGQQALVAASRYAADGARSQRYPTVSAQAAQYTQGQRSTLAGEDLSHPALLRVRQPIWAFGRINSSIAAANADVRTERADLLRVRRQLLEETAVAYAEVRGTQQLIDISRRNVTEHDALQAQIERRMQGQLASSADTRLAATRLTQAKAQLQRALSEWEIARDQLTVLTQIPVAAAEPVPPQLLELPADLVGAAIAHSAEIQVKRRQVGAADAAVERAKTSYMPTIYLQADKLYDQPGLQNDSQISVVFEAQLDGLGFAARGRTGEAVAERMAATQELAASRLELTREVERLQRGRQLQAELMALQRQSLADLESLLASYQRQYETGTKSWLDLMNIQRELFDQRHQLVQSQIDWQIYSLQLQARIGGLDPLAGVEVEDPDDE